MTILNTQSSWNVGKTAAVCAACAATLSPNATCWAALCDRPVVPLTPEQQAAAEKAAKDSKKKPKEEEKAPPSPFVRIDYCEKCWTEGKRPDPAAGLTMFSYWKTSVPVPEQKKKLLVDDAVLVDVFQRMENKTEPQEVRFRFVLALILMRKRLLKYEGMEEKKPAPPVSPDLSAAASDPATPSAPPPELWRMLPRGTEQSVMVINPHLTADQITEVSQQLSAILAEEI